MSPINICIVISSLMLALSAVMLQLSRDLMMLQQNSYRDDRYVRWLNQAKESTAYGRLLAAALFFIGMVPKVPCLPSCIAIGVFSLFSIAQLSMAKYKKPLVWTARAKRIYITALLIVAVILTGQWLLVQQENHLAGVSVCLMAVYAFSYMVMRVSCFALRPVEAAINRRYINEAKKIIGSMPSLKVIGVTGSYGKTSTKHYLMAMLSEKYNVCMTPGNFNTTLGVVRTIREYLKPYDDVFIVEMGAKQKGDIKEICDLVHPQIGIVTAVGPMHLESFGSIENVQATKFELVDSLPSDGLAVVNNDFSHIASRPVGNAQCIRYAVGNDVDANYKATAITYDSTGTTFVISDDKGECMKLHTRLVGECNVSNLMAAAIVAMKLGVPKEKIRYATERIEQVEHRLNMKRLPSGITIIDDAYNSNPVGSKMALDVLSSMNSGRRFIITPGMVELGDEQYALNQEFGQNIAHSVDIAIIVGEYNRDSIMEGLRQGNFPDENILLADTFNEAQGLMLSMAKIGDTVLYENDLPDTFK